MTLKGIHRALNSYPDACRSWMIKRFISLADRPNEYLDLSGGGVKLINGEWKDTTAAFRPNGEVVIIVDRETQLIVTFQGRKIDNEDDLRNAWIEYHKQLKN